jgi:hypothetical protein
VPPYRAPKKRLASSIKSSSPFLLRLFGREISGYECTTCVVALYTDDVLDASCVSALDSSGSSGDTSWVASPCRRKASIFSIYDFLLVEDFKFFMVINIMFIKLNYTPLALSSKKLN